MTAKKSSKRPPGRPEKLDLVERQVIGARVPLGLYQHLVDAAAANRNTISAEIERRLEKSFEPDATTPDDELHALGRDVMTAFEAGGRRASRLMEAFEKSGRRELPAREWMQDPSSYTEAASRALEALVDWHPKPDYGLGLLLIYALRARLDRAWHMVLNEADPEERQKLIERANEIAHHMTPPPSLLDPLPKPPGEKDD